MLEIISFGLITFPVSPLGLATGGYLDTSVLMQLQPYQSAVWGVGASVMASLGPQRLMYDEGRESLVYVAEVLGA